MNMLGPFDHLLFVVLAVFFPIRAATFGFRRLARAPEDQVPKMRIGIYRQIMLLEWGLSALVAVLWVTRGRNWAALGLVPQLNGAAIGVAVGILIVLVAGGIQQRKALARAGAADTLRKRMAKIERILPHSEADLRWFEVVSITAGICEEFLYRGFLIWYLSHLMPFWPAVVVAVVLFGVGHVYQGPAGATRAGLLGAFLALVYLLTRSLYLSMLLHFMADFFSGRVMYGIYRADAERAAGGATGADGAGSASV
jgi:membrane protease YdiL (CAAX protease family)